MQTAYFNGEFLPREDVRVSPDDRGFLFSDGVYEVLRAYGGRLFEVERHVDRLACSLAAMRIGGVSAADLSPVFEDLLARTTTSAADALVYLQVTRGAAPRTHRYPDPPVPPPRCTRMPGRFRPITRRRRGHGPSRCRPALGPV